MMSGGAIVFVHGTGVRLKGYKQSVAALSQTAAAVGLTAPLVECAWGDPLGVEFEGLSLPDPQTEAQARKDEDEFARWSFLFADPLFELDKLTIRDDQAAPAGLLAPGQAPEWLELWEEISAYQPSLELTLLLRRADLEARWAPAWSNVVVVPEVTRLAFERSAHEIAEATHALARALVAELHVLSTRDGDPGPGRRLREDIVARLLADWGQEVYAISDFLAGLFARAATRTVRRHRNRLSEMISLQVGDILLYQGRGQEVRNYIAAKIDQADGPVTLVAHSLGGIACVDLLVERDLPKVSRLVTVGSQSALLYEIGAMASLARPNLPPKWFPPWLNVYDRDDFLSYRADRLFPKAVDFEVSSRQPFPDSHSAYLTSEEVWAKIKSFPGR